ncbi:MAG: helix-turn-helix transcriptional regulator [Lachnospiraceae bacterium]|nr:helix-turn-helix transcriptional regulator [Lachnospiraceae bacterium]
MYSANDLLEKERIKKRISRKRLARGICTPQALAKLANEDANIELNNFKILLERLGRSSEYLEYILSKKEYYNILAQERIESLIMQGNLNSAMEEIECYIPNSDTAAPFAKMYYHRIYAWILNEQKRYKEAEEEIINAIFATLPEIDVSNYKEYLFSTYEYENVLMYAQILFEQNKINDASYILERVFEYICDMVEDKWILATVLPKCAFLMLKYCRGLVKNDIIIECSEQALDVIRDVGVIYLMHPILVGLIDLYRINGLTNKADKISIFKEIVGEILKEFVEVVPQEAVLYKWHRASYNLESEVFKAERIRKGLTQMDISDGVFSDPGAVSNIEKKKHSPNKSSFKKFMKIVEMERPRRSGFVLVESFDRMQLFSNLRSAVNKSDYVEMLSLIGDEKEFSASEIPIINAYKAIAVRDKSQEQEIEATNRIKLFISESYPLDINVYNRKPFLEEADIIIAFLRTQRRNENSASVHKKLIKAFRDSEIDVKYSYCGYTTVATSYLATSGEDLSNDEIIQLVNEIMCCTLRSGNGSIISGVYWAQMRAYSKNNGIDLLACKRAYLFASLFRNTNEEYLKDFYYYYLSRQ